MNIISKIYKNGIKWAFLKLLHQFKTPNYKFIKIFMKTVFFIRNKNIETDCLIAVYDLRTASIAYDFAYFLAGADAFSIKSKKKSFIVYIVTEGYEKVDTSEYHSIVDRHSLKWRMENIIISLLGLYSGCAGYSVFSDRVAAYKAAKGNLTFPNFIGISYTPYMEYREIYNLLSKNKFHGFSAPKQGVKYIKSWMKENNIKNPIVVITIRQYDFDILRNSNIDEWVKFAVWVSKKGFTPVFIPDTESCFKHDKRLDSFHVFRDPCWNLGLRMAIYEEAFLNFVKDGPATIAQLNKKVRFISMQFPIEKSQGSSRKAYSKNAIKIGKRRFNFFKELQIISWEMDTFDKISKEFDEFILLYDQNFSE
jgi:hypothetical protein